MDILAGNCHRCGRYVAQDDFDERRAVVVTRRRYCRLCTTVIIGSASTSTSPKPRFLFPWRIASIFCRGRK